MEKRQEDLVFEKFLSPRAMAEALDVHPGYLAKLRKRGMPYVRLGGKIFYHETEVCRWMLQQQVTDSE